MIRYIDTTITTEEEIGSRGARHVRYRADVVITHDSYVGASRNVRRIMGSESFATQRAAKRDADRIAWEVRAAHAACAFLVAASKAPASDDPRYRVDIKNGSQWEPHFHGSQEECEQEAEDCRDSGEKARVVADDDTRGLSEAAIKLIARTSTAPDMGTKPSARNAGLRATYWNAKRCVWVSVYDGNAAGLDTLDGRWQVVCERHGSILSVGTLKLAHEDARSDPGEFCEDCRADDLLAEGHERTDSSHYFGVHVADYSADGIERMRAGLASLSDGRELDVQRLHSGSEDGYLWYPTQNGSNVGEGGWIHEADALRDAIGRELERRDDLANLPTAQDCDARGIVGDLAADADVTYQEAAAVLEWAREWCADVFGAEAYDAGYASVLHVANAKIDGGLAFVLADVRRIAQDRATDAAKLADDEPRQVSYVPQGATEEERQLLTVRAKDLAAACRDLADRGARDLIIGEHAADFLAR